MENTKMAEVASIANLHGFGPGDSSDASSRAGFAADSQVAGPTVLVAAASGDAERERVSGVSRETPAGCVQSSTAGAPAPTDSVTRVLPVSQPPSASGNHPGVGPAPANVAGTSNEQA